MLNDLLHQILISVRSKQYYVALFVALAIPDIAGAIDSENGRADGIKYAEWFDTYVGPKFNPFGVQYLTGKDCYQYRCAMLHQGRMQHSSSRYLKTVFMVAQEENIAYCGAFTVDKGTTLCVDIEKFCGQIVEAGYEWLEKVERSDRFMKHTAESASLFQLSFEQ